MSDYTPILKFNSDNQVSENFDGSTHLQLFIKMRRAELGDTIEMIAQRGGLPDDLISSIEEGFPYGVDPSSFERLCMAYEVENSLLANIIKLDVDDGHAALFKEAQNEREPEENV